MSNRKESPGHIEEANNARLQIKSSAEENREVFLPLSLQAAAWLTGIPTETIRTMAEKRQRLTMIPISRGGVEFVDLKLQAPEKSYANAYRSLYTVAQVAASSPSDDQGEKTFSSLQKNFRSLSGIEDEEVSAAAGGLLEGRAVNQELDLEDLQGLLWELWDNLARGTQEELASINPGQVFNAIS